MTVAESPPPPSTGTEPASGIGQVVKLASTAIAPATAVTAVLIFTGWVRVRAYFGYFGIGAESLGFGPQDYILRSGDLGVEAVLVLALGFGVILGCDRAFDLLLSRLSRRRVRRRIEIALAIVGILLVLCGLYSATATVAVAGLPSILVAGIVASGALLLLRFGLPRGLSPATLGAPTVAFGLLVLVLPAFWALDRYAHDIGYGSAVQVDQGVIKLAVVTVLSKDQMDLPGVTMSAGRARQFDEQWSYRYSGARLLLHGGGRWFLITSPPTAGYRSTVTVLQDGENVRFQITLPGV
jgi:hypothetical protein